MAWPNPFRRKTANTRDCWGYTFELTDKHLTPEQCEPLKHSYDVLAEKVLDRLNEISPPQSKQLPRGNSQCATTAKNDTYKKDAPEDAPKGSPRDLYAILKEHENSDELLHRFWDDVNTVPSWVDWEQIQRGQDVFYRYGGAMLTGLAYQSLLGGMGAARVVETLARTGGFSTKVARGRLFETTQHILQCTKSLESMQPGGDGFASTIRVRLLHAAVRQRIMKLRAGRPAYYDVEAWGIPINDLDNLATITTFSASLIWMSLPRQGIFVRKQETIDYIALWRYIGYVIGCPDGHFETPGQARRMMEALLLYEIDPSPTSKIMANNIIKSLEGQPPGYTSADFLVASARWLNGNDLCDALGLSRPSTYYWTLIIGQCLFFCVFCYTYRAIPYLDKRKIETLKSVFYEIIVHSKFGLKGQESTFSFKYVPEYSTITEMGECEEEKASFSHVESRNLKAFVIGRFERQANAQYYAAGAGRNKHILNANNSSHSGGAGPRRGSRPTLLKASVSSAAIAGAANEHARQARPLVKSRSQSSSLLELKRPGRPAKGAAGGDDETAQQERSSASANASNSANNSSSNAVQDDDEVAGAIDALRHFRPFHNPELSQPLPEINIAIVGSSSVGKSTFVQCALELPALPESQATERRISIVGDDRIYLVRLLEVPLNEVDIDDDNDDPINWPDTIEDKMMPHVDGVVALYDIQDKSSVEDLPETLSAITKTSIPTVLIANKSDTPPAEREIDPSSFEQAAKRNLGSVPTFQVSDSNPEGHKRGLVTLLNAIVQVSQTSPEEHQRSSSAHRRRAHTNAVRSLSPRIPSAGHSRANSEHTGFVDLKHARVDSKFPAHDQGDRLKVPDDQMGSSFLLEESGSEPATTSSRSSFSGDQDRVPGSSPSSILAESGATFDELVDRLLDQPTSKADLKYTDIFLALYRNFAAPGKLLEAIVQRFDTLEQNASPMIAKSASQLRYLHVLQKWVSGYPGDFAFPKTKRRLQTFATKLSDSRIFAAASREIGLAIDIIAADDDTEWACNDKDSTLLDDPEFNFDSTLSGSTLYDEVTIDNLPKLANQQLLYVEQAQRVASGLHPIPRNPLTKIEWRTLMERPDDLIARELTRMDWIMFSSIRPRDLVRHVSLSKEQKNSCRNLAHVNRMIEHFNQLASWVANYVLLRDKPKHRALMLEKFMRVARKLRELNNYNALGAIIAGVKSTAVHRLAQTRELLPPNVGKDWLKLEILMAPSRSHFAYRLAWENSSTERIPYLPLHRRDLATAEEGNKTFIGDEKDGRINWKKFEIMGDVIVSLQRAQGMPYKNLGGLAGNKEIKELVLDVKLMKDEEELYERSVACEPPGNAAAGSTAKFKEFFRR
ncbi:hypothetical protein AC578_426 [Pseudocercospora eumusae]|uniref:Ras-GEF domain-containing protein n=1 Tax=Pseudocercospora eumusae TaxID=321146 RepID=A0A139HYC8_9PEZI|nr:hypothetical protein AC578_426 [Pseudocercospora eumusae]